jgi:hypothetical protein
MADNRTISRAIVAEFETHTISASAPAAKTKKKPAGVSQGEHEHLLPSEPDKADTQGCDAGAVVDHR